MEQVSLYSSEFNSLERIFSEPSSIEFDTCAAELSYPGFEADLDEAGPNSSASSIDVSSPADSPSANGPVVSLVAVRGRNVLPKPPSGLPECFRPIWRTSTSRHYSVTFRVVPVERRSGVTLISNVTYAPIPESDKDVSSAHIRTAKRTPRSSYAETNGLNHLRSSHSGDACPLSHCEAGDQSHFQSQDEIVEHIKKSHGLFECGIGSCSSASRSRFTDFELLKHFEIAHGMQYDDIGSAGNVAKLAVDRTVRSWDVPACEDCICCRKDNKQATSLASANSLVVFTTHVS
ncbi:uncharacterized protein RSE6_03947 [Rhynchosporium secalis]|uniref:Uncharacterized protein n=1 Tax=Rhynchosporium secalis TaxID=38038 RepID=A0A1E1M412_RHYSE|nr:uncharacterized protein RSE6_03947 [Rhynchosporium secalis]